MIKKYIQQNLIVFALITGIVLVILGWAIALISSNLAFSFGSIRHIHVQHLSLFILDIIPIVLVIFALREQDISDFVVNKYNNIFKNLEKQSENIGKVSSFAEEIGNGNFNANYSIADENDTLGKTLINLRDKLYDNKQKEDRQNWIMTGREKISHILRINNDLTILSDEVLTTLIKYTNVIQGAFYMLNEDGTTLKMVASYAYNRKKFIKSEFRIGEGLVGQAAYEKDFIYRTEIPKEYVTISSGILGDQKAKSILIVPLITDEKLQGVIELASLQVFSNTEIEFVKEISEIVARTIYNLKINTTTEKLLHEAQEMTNELKENEETLRQNAEEMRATQEELEKTNISLEDKITEVNNSQKRLHALLENASEIIAIYNEKKEINFVSPSVISILGYSEEEVIAGKDIERIDFRGARKLTKLMDSLLKNADCEDTVEYTFLRKDNSAIHLESTGRNLLNDPAIQGIILNTRDVTQRKIAEKEQRLRGRMQSLSENSPDIIIRLDFTGKFFYANPKFEYYTGINKDEVNNKLLSEVNIAPEIENEINDILKKVKETKNPLEKEMFIQTTVGESIMNVKAIPEFSDDKQLETVLMVLNDITERKQIEMMIAEKNQKINESINYSRRIQGCILPEIKHIQKIFKHSFMFYKPKDVVSGDFPWLYEKGDYTYLAAVDCTGHGVPGAMLSLVAYFVLHEIVSNDTEILTPGDILTRMHANVIKTLRQDEEGADARDGMDIALCRYNANEMQLHYAGAHRPLYQVRNGELIEYKGTKSPIGGIPKEGESLQVFENNIVDLQADDAIYFFSDGLPDQFGGPDGRKFMVKKIKDIVTKNHNLPINKMNMLIRKEYDTWIEGYKQIDDVLFIGIKF